MRIGNLAAWIVLGLISMGQPAMAGDVQTVAQNRPEQSRTRTIKDFSVEGKQLTDKIANETSQVGKDKTPVPAKPRSTVEPGLIF